jgi:hypothetical protein
LFASFSLDQPAVRQTMLDTEVAASKVHVASSRSPGVSGIEPEAAVASTGVQVSDSVPVDVARAVYPVRPTCPAGSTSSAAQDHCWAVPMVQPRVADPGVTVGPV